MGMYSLFFFLLFVNYETIKIVDANLTPAQRSALPSHENVNEGIGTLVKEMNNLTFSAAPLVLKKRQLLKSRNIPHGRMRSKIHYAKSAPLKKYVFPKYLPFGSKRRYRRNLIQMYNSQSIPDITLQNFQMGYPLMQNGNVVDSPGFKNVMLNSNPRAQTWKESFNSIIPKAFMAIGEKSTSDPSTTLRPWQMNCCPQYLQTLYNEGSTTGKPWSCRIGYCDIGSKDISNTTTESTSSSLNPLNSTLVTITNSSDSTIGSMTVSTTVINTADRNNTSTSSYTNPQMNSTEESYTNTIISSTNTSSETNTHLISNSSASTLPDVKNTDGRNLVKYNNPFSIGSQLTHSTKIQSSLHGLTSPLPLSGSSPTTTSKSRTSVITVVRRPADTIVHQMTTTDGTKMFGLFLNLENTTAMHLQLQLPIQGKTSNYFGPSLNVGKFPVSGNLPDLKELIVGRNVFQLSSYNDKNNKDNKRQLKNEINHDINEMLKPKDTLMNKLQTIKQGNQMRRSVHVDFFSIKKDHPCRKLNKTDCKRKYQTAPFYNLTSLLGIERKPIWRKKGLVVFCPDEIATAKNAMAANVQHKCSSVMPVSRSTQPTTKKQTTTTRPPLSTMKLLLALYDRPDEKTPSTCVPIATYQSCTNESKVERNATTNGPSDLNDFGRRQKRFRKPKVFFRSSDAACSSTVSGNNRINSGQVTNINTITKVKENLHDSDSLQVNEKTILELRETNHRAPDKSESSFPYEEKNSLENCFPMALPDVGKKSCFESEIQNRSKRNTTSQYTTENPTYTREQLPHGPDLAYLVLPWNLLKDNSKIMLGNGENDQNEKNIKPRSIFGQLLPCCIGKGTKPRDQDKKPWEQPWIPDRQRFQTHIDFPSKPVNQLTDLKDLQLIRSVMPKELTTPSLDQNLIEFDFTSGNRSKNNYVKNQNDMRSMLDGSNEFDNFWNDMSTTSVPVMESIKSGSNDMGCGNCWTYVLNYPKDVKEDTYSVSRRATTMKTLRFIETLNESPKYFMEIPEALGDFIKRTAFKSTEANPVKCSNESMILFEKKSKSSKNLRNSGTKKSNFVSKEEPVFIVLRPYEINKKKAYLTLKDLYEFLNEISLQSTSLPFSHIDHDEDLIHDLPRLKNSPDSGHDPQPVDSAQLTNIQLALIPMYLSPQLRDHTNSIESNRQSLDNPRLVQVSGDTSLDEGRLEETSANIENKKIRGYFPSWASNVSNDTRLNLSNGSRNPFNERYSTAWPYFKPPYSAIMNKTPDDIPYIEFRKNQESQQNKRADNKDSYFQFTSNIDEKFKLMR